MIARTVILNPVEPSPLSLRTPLGVEMVLDVTFVEQNGSPTAVEALLPQLMLMPRSRGGYFGYDFVPATDGRLAGIATVPGPAMVDRYGYTLEVYSRRSADYPENPPVPTALIAKGVVMLDGSAYQQMGPFSAITVPVVVGPPGPPGPAGPPGQRGSIWTTGSGGPTITGSELDGDMYLNEDNGDVWRFSGATGAWARGSFA